MANTIFTAEVIAAFISGIIGPISVMWLSNRHKKQQIEKKDILADELRLSNVIQSKIEEVRNDAKADRVWIMQFHNGGNFYPTGRSIQKFSMFYETVGPNTSSIQSTWQNIPVNLFSRSTNQLVEHDKISVPNFTDNDIESFGLKYMAEENKSKSMYMFSLRTLDGKFVGMMGVDYVQSEKSLSVEDTTMISIESGAIGSVLMNHLTVPR